jgi:hypothetical protein
MYSLGAAFYHLTSGQPPFEAETTVALMMKHIQEPLTPLYVVNPKAPADLCDVIHRVMSKDPNDRYEDYDDLVAELRQVELHRRSKEAERQALIDAEPPPLAAGDSETAVISAPAGPEAAPELLPKPPRRAPEARLIDIPMPPEKSHYLTRLISGLAIFALILAAVTLLMRETPDEGGTRRSGFALLMNKLLGEGQGESRWTAEEERLQAYEDTRVRMNLVNAASQNFNFKMGRYPHTVAELMEKGLVTVKTSQDAWGREFRIYAPKKWIVSFGMDGIEGNADDFQLDQDGAWLGVPLEVRDMDKEKKAVPDVERHGKPETL